MAIKIREIILSDYEAVWKMEGQVHRLHSENRPDIFQKMDSPLTEQAFRKTLEDKNQIALLAEENGTAAAYCIVTLRPPSKNPMLIPRTAAWMEELCVCEEYRRRGIGNLLFREACRRAKMLHAESMELMVWSFNKPAERFYEQEGMALKSETMEIKL
jgi:ribosomal protein S18 acetylase RimI-like enzyme